MELSPYHTHRFPSSPTVTSPATVHNGLPDDPHTHDPNSPNYDPHAPLLPATQSRRSQASVYTDLVPFGSWWSAFKSLFTGKKDVPTIDVPGTKSGKHVVIAGGGGNIPLEILRTLSEWVAILEERGTVPGTTVGLMIPLIGALEDSLTALERILTTPLPL